MDVELEMKGPVSEKVAIAATRAAIHRNWADAAGWVAFWTMVAVVSVTFIIVEG